MVIKRYISAFALIAATLVSAEPVSAQLRAGAAKIDISPTQATLPAPVHDPIFARSLMLENGKDKLLFIAIETPGLAKTDALLDRLSKELKIPRDHILMAATHDHSAPFMAPPFPVPEPYPYYDLVADGVVASARQALANLKPARIGYRTGKAYVNVNRDELIGGKYTMGYAPEGPSDKTVAVMTVTDASGKPMAVYANYAVHGVVMFFSKTKDGQLEVTGDLPGAASRFVEQSLGNDVVALWTSGAAGDQNPVFTSVYQTQDGTLKDSGTGGWALLDAQARRLGEEIVRVVGDTRELSDRAEFGVRSAVLTCPGQKQAMPGGAPAAAITKWSPARPEMIDGDAVRIPLTLMRVGDIAFAGVGGELFTEIGMAVKAQSPFDRMMVVTHLPDSVGYIPSDRAYTLPSEKAATASMKPGCADVGIPGTFEELANEMLGSQNRK